MNGARSMRILFHVTLTTMLRHFESVLLALADRGHVVRIASHRSPEIPPPAALVAGVVGGAALPAASANGADCFSVPLRDSSHTPSPRLRPPKK